MVNIIIILDGDDVSNKISMAVKPTAKKRTLIESKASKELLMIIDAWWNAQDALSTGAKIAKSKPTEILENPEIAAEFMINFMRNHNNIDELKAEWVKQLSGRRFKEVKKKVKLKIVKGASHE